MEKITIHTSEIIKDISEGLTWKKEEDLGYGSIEEKYGITLTQVAILKQHPRFKDIKIEKKIELVDDVEQELRKKPEINLIKEPIKEEKKELISSIEKEKNNTTSLDAFNNI